LKKPPGRVTYSGGRRLIKAKKMWGNKWFSILLGKKSQSEQKGERGGGKINEAG